MSTLSLENNLLEAVLNGDYDRVQQYIAKGANPNKITSQGKTCLGEACNLGNIEIVKLFLNMPCPVCNSVNKKGSIKNFKSQKRKLKSRIDDGSFSKCKTRNEHTFSNKNSQGQFMLSSDGSSGEESKVNNVKSPTNPQGLAITTLQTDLEWDEDIGTDAPATSEDEKWTSMYRWYAAILEKTGEAIAATSNVTNGVNQQDAYMRTALHYAAHQGHTEIVKILLDSGSKVDLTAGDGLTALHTAVIKDKIDTVQVLLSAGSRINYQTHDNITALHFAASGGYLELVKVLVNNGANVDARETRERTALYLAVERQYLDVVKYLISSGANVNGEEIHGYTPLCEAVWRKYTEIVEVLLNSGARITHSHKLLHSSILQGQEGIAKMLINQGGSINLHNDAGYTPLLLAVHQSQLDIVKELLQKNANVNACNSITGANALHIAVESFRYPERFEKLLLCLINYKIDLNAMALTGDTPLNRALLLQIDFAAMLLIRHGADVNKFDMQSCGLDNLTMVKRRDSNILANLLLKAGHYWPIHQGCVEPAQGTVAYWIHNTCKEPFSLLDLCRIQIRTLFRCRALYKCIPLLPIPISLKQFLMFEDEGKQFL